MVPVGNLEHLEEVLMDRSAISQAVAKVIAYKNCGKANEADHWFGILAGLLGYPVSTIVRQDVDRLSKCIEHGMGSCG
jgi:hypothetical protein